MLSIRNLMWLKNINNKSSRIHFSVTYQKSIICQNLTSYYAIICEYINIMSINLTKLLYSLYK